MEKKMNSSELPKSANLAAHSSAIARDLGGAMPKLRARIASLSDILGEPRIDIGEGKGAQAHEFALPVVRAHVGPLHGFDR